jgi:hypothetical protein
VLTLLEDVHQAVLTGTATRSTAWWTGPLGLTAQNAVMTRRAMRRRADAVEAGGERGPTTPLSEWLLGCRDELAEVGELLVDQRPDVLDAVGDQRRRNTLAELVDEVGAALAPLPDLEFAERVTLALECWFAAGVAETGDPVVRDLAGRGRRVASGYRAAVAKSVG